MALTSLFGTSRKLAAFSLLLGITLPLVGCGGSGGGDTAAEPEPETELNWGGTPSSPAPIDLTGANAVRADLYSNYFSYTAAAGDQIHIHVTLEKRVTDDALRKCSAGPTAYHNGIQVPSSIEGEPPLVRSCDVDLRYTFDQPGTYLLTFGYPDDNVGFFHAAVVSSLNGSQPQPAIGAGGTPDKPRYILFDEHNMITHNTLANYYAYDARAGETLYVQSYLASTPSGEEERRCSASSLWESSSAYGVFVEEGKLSCSAQLEHRFTEDGMHLIGFRFLPENTGHFIATVTPAPLE